LNWVKQKRDFAEIKGINQDMFKNRTEAGIKLAEKLKEEFFLPAETLILAVPKGGVPVGKKISEILGLPLDVVIIKKITAPVAKDLIIGAVGKGGVVIWDEELCRKLEVSPEFRQRIVRQKIEDLEKKDADFRGQLPSPKLEGKTIILIDDGAITGATLKTAIAVIRNFRPKEIVVAVPVVAEGALAGLKQTADRLIYLESPEMFFSLGQFYEDFEEVPDAEVVQSLKLN